MIILTKKKFCFELDGEQFTSRGGMEMENAPSWIQKTLLFDLAVKDGDLIVAQDSDTKTEEDVRKAASEPVAPPASESEPADPDENSGETESEEDKDAESNDEVESESEVKPKTTRRTKSK